MLSLWCDAECITISVDVFSLVLIGFDFSINCCIWLSLKLSYYLHLKFKRETGCYAIISLIIVQWFYCSFTSVVASLTEANRLSVILFILTEPCLIFSVVMSFSILFFLNKFGYEIITTTLFLYSLDYGNKTHESTKICGNFKQFLANNRHNPWSN